MHPCKRAQPPPHHPQTLKIVQSPDLARHEAPYSSKEVVGKGEWTGGERRGRRARGPYREGVGELVHQPHEVTVPPNNIEAPGLEVTAVGLGRHLIHPHTGGEGGEGTLRPASELGPNPSSPKFPASWRLVQGNQAHGGSWSPVR